MINEQNIVWVLLVLVLVLPQLIHAIEWLIKTIKSYIRSHRESFEKGQEAQREETELEERFITEEKKIEKLMEKDEALFEALNNINKSLEWLNESDNLSIKQLIKHSWEKSVEDGEMLDSYDFELLEHKYEIYRSRGGNSWAAQMMNEIREARKFNAKNN